VGFAHQLVRHGHTHLLHFQRFGTAQKTHRAAQRVPAQQPIEVVRQGVVNGGLDVPIEAQHTARPLRGVGVVGGVVDVVAQHLRVPAGKSLLALKVRQRAAGVGPGIAPAPADLAG